MKKLIDGAVFVKKSSLTPEQKLVGKFYDLEDEFRAGKLGRMTLEMPVKKARLTIPGAKKDDESKPQEENSDGED